MRVFDDANHPAYGPVRRLWKVLAQLDLNKYDVAYRQEWDTHWDECVAGGIAHGLHEVGLCRLVVRRMLKLAGRAHAQH